MSKYSKCVIDPDGLPAWQAQDESRCVSPLITDESCGAGTMLTRTVAATSRPRVGPGRPSGR